jgi:NAD(P)-dependent dehydrogenase (short-subunit alcohol dehydrogenase family)
MGEANPDPMVERFLGDQHDCQPATDPRTNKELAAAFKDKNVVIAGAGRGIGRATAEFFAHTNAKSLSLMALELNEVDETASLCKKINPNLLTKTAAFDVKDYAKAEQFINEADKEFGKIDVVFANAGRPPQWLATWESDPGVWWDTLAVSLQGAFNFARAALPIMRRENGGSIVFTSSAGAHVSNGMGSYALGKLGLVRLAEILHHENKDANIRTFAIHPGAIPTRFFHDFKDAAEGNIKENSYVSKSLPGEEKSASTAVGFFKDVTWDTPQMPAGYVVLLSSGKMDFLSGRYVDCSRKVESYEAEEQKIIKNDLHRVKLVVDTDTSWFIPPAKEEQQFYGGRRP